MEIDYKEKYELAMERAKNFIENGDERERTIAESIFAGIMEESEDERIRKALMQNLKERFGTKGNMGEGLDMPDVLAWLEKQGKKGTKRNNGEIPNSAWSEEDEINLEKAIWYVENPAPMVVKDSMLVEWLKSLRPQSHWKPSEEMLEALYRAIPKNVMAISEDEMLLDKLYQGLKHGRVLGKN